MAAGNIISESRVLFQFGHIAQVRRRRRSITPRYLLIRPVRIRSITAAAGIARYFPLQLQNIRQQISRSGNSELR
jgi:hypothetical protein